MATEVVSCSQVGLCVGVIFLEELYNAKVVFESDNVGLRESSEVRHVCLGGRESAKDVFGKADGIEFEVGLEE